MQRDDFSSEFFIKSKQNPVRAERKIEHIKKVARRKFLPAPVKTASV